MKEYIVRVTKTPDYIPIEREEVARELVRCKDCKYAHMTYGGECKWCDKMSELGLEDDDIYLPGDWFCADGERREQQP